MPRDIPAEVRARLDAIDALATPALRELKTEQDVRVVNDDRYWQALDSHSSPPKDGVSTPADRLNRSPHYHSRTWNDVGTIPLLKAMLPNVCVTINIYKTPRSAGGEHGYETVFCIDGGRFRYQRVINEGPETYREQAWHEFDPKGPGATL